MDLPLVSVIIVNYNTRDLRRACLGSIFQQTQKIDFEKLSAIVES